MTELPDPFEGKRVEDEPSPEPEEEAPPALVPEGKACFPVNSQGMPKALKEIPAKELRFYWKDMRYRNHFIAYVEVQDPRHAYLFSQERDRAFYVRAHDDMIGLVPFPNSTIVWPWEAGWAQDLAPENQGKVRRDLKPSEKK